MGVISIRIELSGGIVQLMKTPFLSRLARARGFNKCGIDCGIFRI